MEALVTSYCNEWAYVGMLRRNQYAMFRSRCSPVLANRNSPTRLSDPKNFDDCWESASIVIMNTKPLIGAIVLVREEKRHMPKPRVSIM